jgi:hypothetical protein
MAKGKYCVVDAQIVSIANALVKVHASDDQKARWNLLRAIGAGKVTPLKSDHVIYEYIQILKGKPLHDPVRVFLAALDRVGKKNWRGLDHSDVAAYQHCRFPSHDDHLLKTAKGFDDAVISTEEPALLGTSSCISKTFGIRVLPPANALEFWGLAN